MNRLILDKFSQRASNIFVVTDTIVLQHLQNTLKLKRGGIINVCIIDRGLGSAKIIALSEQSVQLEVIAESPGLPAKCHLIVALNRPPMMKRILEHGTTQGIKSFHFIKAELSEKSYLQSKVLQEQEFIKYTNLGLAQSGHYFQRPQLSVTPYFNIVKTVDKKFVLDGRGLPLSTEERPFTQEFTLALGPERGWTQEELAAFLDRGFQAINLGPSTLRVEHALYYGLGQIGLFQINCKDD